MKKANKRRFREGDSKKQQKKKKKLNQNQNEGSATFVSDFWVASDCTLRRRAFNARRKGQRLKAKQTDSR